MCRSEGAAREGGPFAVWAQPPTGAAGILVLTTKTAKTTKRPVSDAGRVHSDPLVVFVVLVVQSTFRSAAV